MQALINSLSGKIAGNPSPAVAFKLQVIRQAVVLLHVLRLVWFEVFCFTLVHWRDVSVRCDYGQRDSTEPVTLYHLFPYNRKRCSCSPGGITVR